jgi:hypothetical protein
MCAAWLLLVLLLEVAGASPASCLPPEGLLKLLLLLLLVLLGRPSCGCRQCQGMHSRNSRKPGGAFISADKLKAAPATSW